MTPAKDEARFWRSGKWPGIELMRAHWVRHAFPTHFHDCYTIGIANWPVVGRQRRARLVPQTGPYLTATSVTKETRTGDVRQ